MSSNTLAGPSLIVQNGCQNATERKSPKDSFLKILISHLKTTFFMFKDGTNEFRDPENIE